MNKITSINGTFIPSLNELNEHVENGTAHVTEDERTAWNAKATVKAQGILIATQEDLDEHAGNKVVHLTEEERTTWNAKADASALSTKTDTTVFDAHKNDAGAHITGKERETWNGKQDKLTDEADNIALSGGLTATSGTFNGPFNAGDPAGTLGNGRFNNIYGTTWFHQQAELRAGGIVRGDVWVESGTIRVNTGGALLSNGGVTFNGTVTSNSRINANGGINIPQFSLDRLTNTTVLNAYTAAGLIGLQRIWQEEGVVNRSACKVSGPGKLNDWPEPGGAGLEVSVPKMAHASAYINFTPTMGGGWNLYGDWCGYYLPLGLTLLANETTRGVVKLSWVNTLNNGGRYRVTMDATDMDKFAMEPTGESYLPTVVDVTLYTSATGAGRVRVRYLHPIDVAAKTYEIKTTMSDVPNLVNLGGYVRGLIWAQRGADKIGGLWLVIGNNVYKIATLPIMEVFEMCGLQCLCVDVFGGDISWGTASTVVLSTVANYSYTPWGDPPIYDALEAIGTVCNTTVTTEPWTIPTT